MQKASLETIKQAGEWTELSYFQQKKLAEAAGMTVGEIGTQLTREKQLEALKHGTAEQQKMYNRYMQMQSDLQDGNNKSLEQQGEEMIKQELMQSKMNELKDRFRAIMTELGEKLLPLVEVGFSLIVPIVQVLFETAKLILMPFTVLSDIVRALTGDFSGLGERFGSFGDIAYTALGLIIGSVVLLNTKLLGLGPLIGKVGTGISGMFTGGKEALAGLTKGLGDFFNGGETGATSLGSKMRTMFDGLSKKVTGMFSSDDAVKGATKKAKDKIKSTVADKAKDVAEDVAQEKVTDSISSGTRGGSDVSKNSMPDVDTDKGGKGVTSFAEKFNSIDMKKILQGAAALLVLSGALWVSAKAFQEFGKVTWDGVLKGTAALGVLVGGLYAIGKVMDQNADKILKGSLAIAAIGAALLPAAYAFDMFGDVNWGGLLFGITALGAFTVAIMAIGAIMKSGVGAVALLAGAAAIAVLGVALVPAAYAMDIMSGAFATFTDALNTLEWESIAKVIALQVAFAGIGILAPAILIGAGAAMALGAAVGILAVGAWVLSDAIDTLGPAIVSLGDSAGSLIAFAGAVSLIGLMAPLVLLGAAALGVLGIAMIPVAAASILVGAGFSLMANAVSELDSVNLVGLVFELGLAFGLLGLMAPAIALGAVAMGIMTVALIPFSAALLVAGAGMALFGMGLEMTMDSLKDAPEAALGLIAFVGAVSMIALLAPLVIVGAVALGILGIGLALLAVPLLVVSAAMWVLGSAMKLMGDAIESMAESGAIGMIFGLGAAFIFLATILPAVILGALSMWIMTAALLPLSVALFTAGLGMKMLVDGLNSLESSGDKVKELTAVMYELGSNVLVFVLAAAGLYIIGSALLFFGIAASIASVGVALMGAALTVLQEPMLAIMDGLVSVIDSLTGLGEVGPGLISAAVGAFMLAGAILVLGAAMASYGIMSMFFAENDPIEQFIRLGKVGPEIEAVGNALGVFASAADGIGEMGDSLEGIADGLDVIFEVMSGVPDTMGSTMAMVGQGMKDLLSAFGPEFLAFSVVADLEDPLEGLGDGIEAMFDSLEDVDISIAPNFSIIGEGMNSLLGAFSGGVLLELNEDVEDILEGLGYGIGEFFEGLEDVDPAIVPVLGAIGPSISQLLVSLGTEGLAEFDTDLEDVFEGLGDGVTEFMSSIEGFDADQILAMSGVGDAIARILEGIGSVGEIDFDADDFGDVLESVGEGVESLFEPMRGMDDDLLEAARSVGGVLSGLFSNLGTIGEVGDDWDDVFEGFGEGVEAMFDELNDIDRKDLKIAVLVGDVMAELFSAFEGINLTEDLGDAVETLGEGIYELFDEIEEVDEEAMDMASSVGRAVSRLFNNLPLDAMSKINPETIGDQLNELGYGIYELFYEMDVTDFEEDLELMSKVGLSIQNVVLPIINTDLSAIPKDVGSILNDLGAGIYDLFDEMDDLGGEEETLDLMSGMGGFGQMLSGVAAISDTGVDMTALSEIADSMRMIITSISEIYEEIEDEEDSAFSGMWNTASEGKSQDAIGKLVERMRGLGEGARALIDGFGDLDLLKELASMNVGELISGITTGMLGLVQLVNPETFGREFETEDEASDYFAHLSVRMSLLGKGVQSIIQAFSDLNILSGLGEMDLDGIMWDMQYGIRKMMDLVDVSSWWSDESEEDATKRFDEMSKRMKFLGEGMQSIIGAFSDVDTLSALGEIDFDGIMSDMQYGIKSMMRLTEWGWYVGDEEEETDYYAQISQRMKSLGEGMQSIIGAFSDVDTLSALGEIDFEGVMEDMRWGIKSMMRLTEWGWYVGDEEEETDYYAQISQRMQSLGEGMQSIIGAFSDIDTLNTLNNIDFEGIMEDMQYGIKSMMRLAEWGWYVGDEQEETDYYAQMSERMKSLGEGVGSIIDAFSDIDTLSALGDIDLDDIMVDMKYGIKGMMQLTEWGWYVGDEQEETDYYAQMSERMKSLGEGVGSIVGAFSDIDTMSTLNDIDFDGVMADMKYGVRKMMDLVDVGTWWWRPTKDEDITKRFDELSKRMKALGEGVGSIIGGFSNISSIGDVDVEDVMEGMSAGIEEIMDTMSDIDESALSKFVKLGEALATISISGTGIDVAFNGLKSIASQEFVDGLSRATSAIYDFAYALLALNNVDDVDGIIQGEPTTPTSGIFDDESSTGTADFDQLARYSGGAFGRSAGESNTPLVVETLASVGQSGGSTDMTNVEAKLGELIGLMKSGGIAVNLDGRKVHKGLASSVESSPIS